MAGLGRDGRTSPACRSRPAWRRSCGRRGRSCPCPSRPRGRGSASIALHRARRSRRPGAPSARAAPRASMSKVSRASAQRALGVEGGSREALRRARGDSLGSADSRAAAPIERARSPLSLRRMASTLELTLLYLRRRGGRRGRSAASLELPPMLGYLAVGVADRAERAGAGAGLGRRALPGRVRRRVPDVRDRARVQPAQAAQHAHARVRPRPAARSR